MTTELAWLLLTALLAASLWIPYIIGINVSTFEGKDTIFGRPPDQSKMPAWVQRSYRAHLNLLEQFAPFAVIVLMAHMSRSRHQLTQWCAILFFWLRVVHAIGMITAARRGCRCVL